MRAACPRPECAPDCSHHAWPCAPSCPPPNDGAILCCPLPAPAAVRPGSDARHGGVAQGPLQGGAAPSLSHWSDLRLSTLFPASQHAPSSRRAYLLLRLPQPITRRRPPSPENLAI
eukprot:6184441-Pleurochrysis_carterae.AAC.3